MPNESHPTVDADILFVNHTSVLGGGEYVLLSIVRMFGPRSALWMFQDGPLREALRPGSVRPVLPRVGAGMSSIKRDRSMLASVLPHGWSIMSMCLGIARAARGFAGVYANSQKAFVLSAVAARLARRPLVWHLHDILLPAHFGRGQIKLLQMLASSATRIIVPSTAVAEALSGLDMGAGRVRVVPNGVTLPPDPDAAGTSRAVRESLGLPADAFVFGVFSRLSPWKGQDVAIRALARLPDAWCILAGDALFGESEYAESLPRLAAELGVADRVRFLGYRHDVPALMTAVDAVVHPSLDPEPFGRTLVEGMLCGTPVIATDAGAARDILEDGAAGILVKPGSPEEIADALALVAAGGPKVDELVRYGRARAEAEYSERSMQDGILRVLREVNLVA